ncbi:conserved hypothetical protein [Theileria equi strain WA]|uniref:Mcm6 C-terminal winged-helix domain-containing protein n=1 Tax=Theileria equi strain WA TaxID=1537102 RepID=L1LFQ0_THEEQ|nr:conserved hypothetical protein [Theileria equi strain WA]EKX74242.1 conserved hypothetical protein [Theileria equi strain WA]|eukprot:XP_004833694.1 conserved hypothetical protein [Theileria equi strain WA]
MSAIDIHSNLTIDYGAYVHFAYHVGKYLIQKCEYESCDEKSLVKWYLDYKNEALVQNPSSLEKSKLIYEKLIDNLIYDECVMVVGRASGSRMIKRHPEFFVWAWRSLSKLHEQHK